MVEVPPRVLPVRLGQSDMPLSTAYSPHFSMVAVVAAQPFILAHSPDLRSLPSDLDRVLAGNTGMDVALPSKAPWSHNSWRTGPV